MKGEWKNAEMVSMQAGGLFLPRRSERRYAERGVMFLEVFLFSLLCLGTLFLNSFSFVNAQTTPQWYFFIFCSAAILATFAVYNIFSDVKKLRPDNLVLPVCLMITTLCTIQDEKNNKLKNENTRQGETPDLQPSGIALPP